MACSLLEDLNDPTYRNDCMEVIDLEMRTKIVNGLGTNFHLWRFFFSNQPFFPPYTPRKTLYLCIQKFS